MVIFATKTLMPFQNVCFLNCDQFGDIIILIKVNRKKQYVLLIRVFTVQKCLKTCEEISIENSFFVSLSKNKLPYPSNIFTKLVHLLLIRKISINILIKTSIQEVIIRKYMQCVAPENIPYTFITPLPPTFLHNHKCLAFNTSSSSEFTVNLCRVDVFSRTTQSGNVSKFCYQIFQTHL